MNDDIKCPKCGIPINEHSETCGVTVRESLEMRFAPELARKLEEAESQVRYMCEEFGRIFAIGTQTPADTVSLVRALMEYAGERDSDRPDPRDVAILGGDPSL